MKNNRQLQSVEESGPLFQEQTNIPVTQNSLLWEDIKDFFYWWYIQMPVYYLLTLRRTHFVLIDKLSISLLYRNFFTPWQRSYTTLNLLIGVFIKLVYLPIAVIIYTIVITGFASFFVVWLILPLLTLILLVLSPITT